jgi:hypothetical protein
MKLDFVRCVRMTGSDPEVFMTDAAGQLVPAWQVLPHREAQNSRLYYDGFAAEFTTQPATCHLAAVKNVGEGLRRAHRAAQAKGLKLTARNTWEIPAETMAGFQEELIQLGCNPSFNAYDMEGDIRRPARELRWRSAGGHVHVDLTRATYNPATARYDKAGVWHSPDQLREAVKMCDAVIGVMAVSLAASFDDPARRRFYGLPGEFRLPVYGLEYRTLSNYWLIHPVLAHLTLDMTRMAVNMGLAGLRAAMGVREEDVVNCIRFCDVPLARKLLTESPAYLAILQRCYGWTKSSRNPDCIKKTMSMILNGLESYVDDPHDFAGNWAMDAEKPFVPRGKDSRFHCSVFDI